MIIGMLGFIGCGKGTASDYFIDRGFVNESFAAPLKDAVSNVFGWPREMLEGDTKESREFRETPCAFWGSELKRPEFTPRIALQEVGTELFRDNFYSEMWVASMRKRLIDHQCHERHVVISDVRFKNEVAMLRELGATLCAVRRGPLPEWYAYAIEANSNDDVVAKNIMATKYADIHQSEWDWIGCELDFVLHNDDTLQSFYDDLEWMKESIDRSDGRIV